MKTIRYDIAPPSQPVRPGRKKSNPFDSMEVGGSFVVPDERLSAVRVSVCRENKKSKKKFQVGRYESKRGVEWRCWRMA